MGKMLKYHFVSLFPKGDNFLDDREKDTEISTGPMEPMSLYMIPSEASD